MSGVRVEQLVLALVADPSCLAAQGCTQQLTEAGCAQHRCRDVLPGETCEELRDQLHAAGAVAAADGGAAVPSLCPPG